MTAEQEREAVVAYMREAIEQRYPMTIGARDLCFHGQSRSGDCIACYYEHLLAALDAISRGDHLTHKESKT